MFGLRAPALYLLELLGFLAAPARFLEVRRIARAHLHAELAGLKFVPVHGVESGSPRTREGDRLDRLRTIGMI